MEGHRVQSSPSLPPPPPYFYELPYLPKPHLIPTAIIRNLLIPIARSPLAHPSSILHLTFLLTYTLTFLFSLSPSSSPPFSLLSPTLRFPLFLPILHPSSLRSSVPATNPLLLPTSALPQSACQPNPIINYRHPIIFLFASPPLSRHDIVLPAIL